MADVYAVFGTLIALGVAYPGMLVAWRLLFPEMVIRAQARVSSSPWGSLGLGIAAGVPVILLSIILLSAPGPIGKFLGLLIVVLAFGFASLGASGLAASMGAQLNDLAGGRYSMPGAHVRGAVALQFSAIFPFIGWLVVFPISTLICLGASLRALFVRGGDNVPSPQPAGD